MTRIEPSFDWGSRTYVMGVLNVTPDSFSDGGEHLSVEAAVARAREMVAEGADVIDVGGESTRPGGDPVSAEEEWNRVGPVLAALQGQLEVPLSIDTYKAEVAERALERGAAMVNDVWGLERDPRIAQVVAAHDAWLVVVHNQAEARYRNLMEDILEQLRNRVERAVRDGVSRERIMIDPGFGFAKAVDENLELASRLAELGRLGLPVLYGPSRKTTIGHVLSLPATERVEGTAALVALAVAAGVDVVRVHDVQVMYRVARMADAVIRRQAPAPGRLTALEAGGRRAATAPGASRDRIVLKGIPGRGRHGVLAEERQEDQPFRVDLELELQTAPAGTLDRLEATVDYGEIYLRVREILAGDPVNLVETLAERIAGSLLDAYPLEAVRVTVHKPEAPLPGPFDDVAVDVYRQRGQRP